MPRDRADDFCVAILCSIRCESYNVHVLKGNFNFLDELDSVHPWHPEIGDHHIEMVFAQFLQGILPVHCGNARVTQMGEDFMEYISNLWIIIHSENMQLSFVQL